jgi:hypothetical protein
MEQSLAFIQANPREFKWCKACNCFNSKVNNKCHNCDSTDFDYTLDLHIETELLFNAYAQGNEPEDVYYTVK